MDMDIYINIGKIHIQLIILWGIYIYIYIYSNIYIILRDDISNAIILEDDILIPADFEQS